jgi:hypothetical protein
MNWSQLLSCVIVPVGDPDINRAGTQNTSDALKSGAFTREPRPPADAFAADLHSGLRAHDLREHFPDQIRLGAMENPPSGDS